MAKSIDYEKIALKVEKAIKRAGRPVVLQNHTSRDLIDVERPWKGYQELSEPETLDLVGVFVPPNQVRIFGLSALGESTKFDDLIQRSELIMITYPFDMDTRDYQKMVDYDDSIWQITATQQMRPAEKLMLSFIGVTR